LPARRRPQDDESVRAEDLEVHPVGRGDEVLLRLVLEGYAADVEQRRGHQLPESECTLSKKRSFHDDGFLLIRPILFMNSAVTIRRWGSSVNRVFGSFICFTRSSIVSLVPLIRL